MADPEVNALATRLETLATDTSSSCEFSFLIPETTQLTHLHKHINLACSTREDNSTFERNDEQGVQNCMAPYVWKGLNSTPFVDVAKTLLISSNPDRQDFWLSHKICDDVTEFSPSLHNSQFHFCVTECSVGAFVDPFTFSKHAEASNSPIKATFDFNIDTLTLIMEDMHKLDVSFGQLKDLLVINPGSSGLPLNYTIYIYFASVPRLWKKNRNDRSFSRILNWPGVRDNVIGHCSALKLRLGEVEEPHLMTLVNKLVACQFRVWWAPMKTVLAPEMNHIWNRIDSFPWSMRWLFSEGFRVTDQLADEDVAFFRKHEASLYTALQGKLAHNIIVNVKKELYDTVSRKTPNLKSLLMPDLKNYTLIPKLVVTPTRLIFLQPSPTEMNRVLREYGTDNFITVSFRDEDSFHLIGGSAEQFSNLIVRIKAFLRQGLKVGGSLYELLGCSNSQLRQHSCWMYARNSQNEDTVDDIRRWVGDLGNIRCVATYVARMGQSFSSSTSTVDLSGHEYRIREVADVTRHQYCFTEGVGRISKDVALKVSKIYGADKLCSAFQIRLGGCKGVLTMHPELPRGSVDVRPSMRKFDSDHKHLEVMEYSRPHKLFMNKQVILLLSQRGIPDEVFFRFQEDALHALLNMFALNDEACRMLGQLDLGIDVLKAYDKGLDVVSDPFFRSVLLEKYEECLRTLLQKTRIPIPTDQGRLLIGVADETLRLSAGQVFIQYSSDITDTPAGTNIVCGPVMITKNPCLHPGDLRVFEAVDCPELHHLVDCLVFPVKGNRPHPNEISGSDLDGDLYWATWHPDLIIPNNDFPMRFPKAVSVQLDREPSQQDIIEYIGEYIKNDRLGTIANAHLAFADVEPRGIYSGRCIKLAKLHSEAVDFAKTGQFPNLEKELKPKKYPDFMMKQGEVKYESPKILGQLFREVSQLWKSLCLYKKTLDKTVIFSKHVNSQLEQYIDSNLQKHPYYNKAKQYYSDYAREMQYLLDTYGLQDEASVMVGSLHKIKSSTFAKGGLLQQAVIMKSEARNLRQKYSVVLRNKDLETDLYIKGSIWYKVSYEDGKFKSFAWVALPELLLVIEQHQTERPMFGIFDNTYSWTVNSENLSNQKYVFQLFLETIEEKVPELRCTLEHRDLTHWNIESNDVYIMLKGNNATVVKQEFADLCLLIPSLNLIQRSQAFGTTGCYITKHGLQQTVKVNNCMINIHIYHSGIYDRLLSEVTSRLSDSHWFRCCFQYFCHFWMICGKQSLRDIITVLHLADLILHYMKNSCNSSVSQSIFGCVRWCTLFSNLTALNKISSELWSLPSDVLRSLQQNFMECLQLISLSGDSNILHNFEDKSGGRIVRRIMPVSQTVSSFLMEMKDTISNILATRSGCSISIRDIRGLKGSLYAVEAFGSERQLKRLADEIQHFEFIISGLFVTTKGHPLIQNVLYIFGEYSSSEKLRVVRYRGPNNLKEQNKNIYMIGFKETERKAYSHGKYLTREDLQKWEHLLEMVRHNCDNQYHGDIRIICRFSCFHFLWKDGECLREMTVKEFLDLENRHRLWTSRFSYNIINPNNLIDYLTKEIGLEHTETEYTTLCSVRTGGNNQINIAYDQNSKLKQLRHNPITLGCLQAISDIPAVDCESKIDVRIQLQAMRAVTGRYMEEYATYNDLKKVLQTSRGREQSEMPHLHIRQEYRDEIRFIRQKKVQSYGYSSTAKQQNCDHFTVHVKVDINRVREYQNFDRRSGMAKDVAEYTDVNVVLPTVPPLHYKEDHRVLIDKVVDICMKIRDVIHKNNDNSNDKAMTISAGHH